MRKLTVVDESSIWWPPEWNTELERGTRYPRKAVHWCASRRTRRDRVRLFSMELDAIIARRIRAERIQAGLRQIDLAEAIGVTQATISRIESGKSPVSVADLVRIAIQFRAPLETFITPPQPGPRTGWERHPTKPIIPRDLHDAAIAGELPEEHPIYD